MFDGRLLSGVSVFAAVVASGTFVRAGEALGMSKSGISRAISRLEARLNLRLFHRNGHGVRLTDEGHRFHEQVAPLLAGFEDVANRAAGAQHAVRGRLRVNADAAFGHFLLAPRLGEFLQRHLEVSIDLVIQDRIGDLVADGFDLAVHFGTSGAAGIEVRQLMAVRTPTVAARSYLERKGTPATLPELCAGDHDLIRISDMATGRPDPWIYRRGDEELCFEPRRRFLVNHAEGLLAPLLAGAGIGRPLDFMVREHLRRGTLVELFPDWDGHRVPACLHHPMRTQLSATKRAFVAFVEEIARDATAGEIAAAGYAAERPAVLSWQGTAGRRPVRPA